MIFRAILVIFVGAATLHSQELDAGTFTFREGAGRLLSVTLEAVNDTIAMTWPDAAGSGWDTALLGVRVDADFQGAAPFIEIASGGTSDRQYFRPGETGPRWLNLSFLRGAMSGGTGLSLRTYGVRIAAGNAPLRLFANGLDLSRRLLVLAPHPDDAEIAAYGVYAHRNATIVTMTSGNAGPRSYEAVFDDVAAMYHFKGRIRLIDSITVPWLGGIPPERAFNMGYFDARLAEMYGKPTAVVPEMYGPNTDIGAYLKYNLGSLLPKRSRASTWANLVDDLEAVLKKVNPAVILAPHPQLDSHADHQFATVALNEALLRRRQRVTLLLYTNHADRNRYPYGPAGTLMSLPPVAQDVQLDRVYSHPVPPDLQREKLFALEAMHDLRPSPSRIYQLEIGADRSNVPENLGSSAFGGVNYLRRGPRSNELFYVYDQATVTPIIEAFLADWKARAAR
jgi:LmbE family N-acetylglucosaminyl deacetylase